MTNHLLSTETCATTAGKGMATSWTIGGSPTTYMGALSTTDGYHITASFAFLDLMIVGFFTGATLDCD